METMTNAPGQTLVEEPETRRRMIYKDDFFYPLSLTQNLIIYDLGLPNINAVRWFHHFIRRAIKKTDLVEHLNGRKKIISIDLAETRWDCQRTIAEAISSPRAVITEKTVECLEKKLRALGLIVTRTMMMPYGKRKRYVALGPIVFTIAKASLTKYPPEPRAQPLNPRGATTNSTPPTEGWDPSIRGIELLNNRVTKQFPLLQGDGDGRSKEPPKKTEGREESRNRSLVTQEAPSDHNKAKGQVRAIKPPGGSPRRSGEPLGALLGASGGARDFFQVKQDIQPYLFTMGDPVSWKYFGEVYLRISKFCDDDYFRLVQVIRKYFSEKTAYQSQIQTREVKSWDEFFDALFESAGI